MSTPIATGTAPIRYADGIVIMTLRVQPSASRSELAGRHGEHALRLRLAAPAVDGKANKACIRYLAKILGVPPSAVTIIRGETSRDKLLRAEGVAEQVFQSLRDQWLS